ncbi:macrophage colony-stimulating factor 1 receptor 2 [Brachionichthys hirsutus]|uniref:macrophage colony-stimulating factor 1 receptor 2 n=1 Tax=Brachionichthys hirsutus TaxID=412623 RepID=UPI00360509D5
MKLYSVLLSITLSCCCSAEDPPGLPSIRLNSDFLPNQTEVVLTAGSAFRLSCHGSGSVRWLSTAFRLMYRDRLENPLSVRLSDPRYTGTYHCGYKNQNLAHLDTWIHLYVKDPSDPTSVFVTTRRIPDVKEGDSFLFKCLLTDPSVSNLTLQSKAATVEGGGGLPRGMKVTFDRKKGALIHDLRRSFNGRYICSGWRAGIQYNSSAVDLLVAPRSRQLPSISVSPKESVRLEGEKFQVTCLASHASNFYNVTWIHPKMETVKVTGSQIYSNRCLYTNKTLTVAAVSRTHSGTYTCIVHSEAGVDTATAQLSVVDGPYLTISLQPMQLANAKTKYIYINGELVANISSMPTVVEEGLEAHFNSGSLEVKRQLLGKASTNRMDVNGVIRANISSSTIVEVYEGQDARLTFETKSYPPIRNMRWTTPTRVNSKNNTVLQKSYTANDYSSEASVLLPRVRQQDQGRYTFHLSNAFFNGSQNVDLRIYRSASAVVSVGNDSLTCSSSGYPLPTVLWYFCPGVKDTCGGASTYQISTADVTSQEDEDKQEVRKHLTLPLSLGDDVTVECVAYNHLGESRDVFNPPEPQTSLRLLLTGALSAAAVLLLLLLIVIYKWRQRPRYEIRWKIIESTNGNNYTFIDPTQLPYNHKWEFPRDNLRLGAVLGSGAFGKVVEATAYGLGSDDITRVAVKMLKPRALSDEHEALMSELKILSHLGYHDNIVNLLGACTKGGPTLMITEYCSHGDLLNFLRTCAQDFMASILSVEEVEGDATYKNVASQNARLRSDSGISCCSDYQELRQILGPGQEQQGVQTSNLSVGDLMRFSYQVAQGLDFLSSRNCIHRDVAARNVLLSDHCVAKICDFGLARDIRNDDNYIVKGNARLPVKWMAPESIFQCVYTIQSDVWSYGVLLWEIFSLGKSPYPNIAVDTNFYKMIKDGCHMNQPDFAPAQMYQLMTLCWSLEATDRPTFNPCIMVKMIGQLIGRLLPCVGDSSPHRSDQYKNILECGEEEEEEEVKRGDTLKGGEEERSQRERHDDDDDDAGEVVKNIYQLS